MMRAGLIFCAVTAVMVGGCTTTAPRQPASTNDILGAVLSGQSRVTGAELQRRIAAAAQHPLGSQQNPVRAHMPQGQRAYLARLRCADGRAPAYNRQGNVGMGVFGNITDLYAVQCAGAEAKAVYMDMYHPNYVEQRAVPGFTIVRS